MKPSRLSSIYVTSPITILPIEIELGMPSRCIFIATTNLPAQIPTNQPKSSRQRQPVHESTWPHHPRPMPQQSSCEAKLGRENSILARHSKAQHSSQRKKAQPLRFPRPGCPHRGAQNSLLCFACLLAGWYEINTFTWPTTTRFPAALRNLVKLERRRGVALVIARNPRRPIEGDKPASSSSCQAVTR